MRSSFCKLMLENVHRIRLDLLKYNFISRDSQINALCSNVIVSSCDIWSELQSLNFDDEDALIECEKAFDDQGLDFLLICRNRSLLSSIRRPSVVDWLIAHPDLIDHDKFLANPCALMFYISNPHLINNNKSITRNPTALPFLMNNQHFIDWDTIAGIWYDTPSDHKLPRPRVSIDDGPIKKRTRLS